MTNPVCLKLKDYTDRYICNEKYIMQPPGKIMNGRYETISDDLIKTLEDLIRYCLTYDYEIDIPEGYKVEHLYHIVYSIGDFEPEEREQTYVRSSITFTTNSKSQLKKMFKRMCDKIGKKPIRRDKRVYCWQGEDFAVNQIVQSYSITESYLINKVETDKIEIDKESYKTKVIELIKDTKGFCRKDVLEDLIKQVRSL